MLTTVCQITLLSPSPSYNIAEAYPVLLDCWARPNLKILLMFSLPYYIAELFQILQKCWCRHCLITLLSWDQFQNIAVLYPVSSFGWKSQSWKIVDLYPVLLQSLDVLNLETLLAILCHITLPRSSPSYNIGEAYLVLSHCWAVPHLITLLICILWFCIAEMIPVFEHCWYIRCSKYCCDVSSL